MFNFKKIFSLVVVFGFLFVAQSALAENIVVEKIVSDPVEDTTVFEFTTTGTGYINFTLADTESNNQTLDAGTYSVTETVIPGWNLPTIACVGSVSGNEDPSAILLTEGETVTCTFTNTKKIEYCSQGYWKQLKKHTSNYPAEYYPTDLFDKYFDNAFPDKSLSAVLSPVKKMSNGGLYALGRAAVAALLSSAHPDLDYSERMLDDDGVIAVFNEAFLAGTKVAYEEAIESLTPPVENSYCPLH